MKTHEDRDITWVDAEPLRTPFGRVEPTKLRGHVHTRHGRCIHNDRGPLCPSPAQ